MQPFSSRQLYLMNGGNKTYIYKDGFGDVYHATPAEEAGWSQEVIAAALAKINTSNDGVELNSAIENLRFHAYAKLDALLQSKLEDASPVRRNAFAAALKNKDSYAKSVEAIYLDLAQHKDGGANDVFLQFGDFKSEASKLFILACVEGDDDELFIKATITLGRWAYSGLPALRRNRLLETLQPENRQLPTFKTAVEQLKSIFQINTNL